MANVGAEIPVSSPGSSENTRPAWLPEAHWDARGGLKPEFGAHYRELTSFHKTETERQTALKARQPDDIKVEVKLPEGVKPPDGMQLKIDEKDPRIPALRDLVDRL
jgi:hypothetical protein